MGTYMAAPIFLSSTTWPPLKESISVILKHVARRVSFLLAFIIPSLISLVLHAEAREKWSAPGRQAVVFDERLSALRAQPDIKAPLERRLRRGHVVGILGTVDKKSGERFLLVAVSRNTKGWILADAVVRPGNISDAAKL